MKAIGQGQEGGRWATEIERSLVAYIDPCYPQRQMEAQKMEREISYN